MGSRWSLEFSSFEPLLDAIYQVLSGVPDHPQTDDLCDGDGLPYILSHDSEDLIAEADGRFRLGVFLDYVAEQAPTTFEPQHYGILLLRILNSSQLSDDDRRKMTSEYCVGWVSQIKSNPFWKIAIENS
jgi:hypothetical protein